MSNLDKTGSKLKNLRKKYGYTLDKLSELTGITVSSLSYYESGKRNPSDENKCLIARVYQKKVGEIFFNEK